MSDWRLLASVQRLGIVELPSAATTAGQHADRNHATTAGRPPTAQIDRRMMSTDDTTDNNCHPEIGQSVTDRNTDDFAGELTDRASIRRYLTGGKATFTIEGKRSRYTFRTITRPDRKDVTKSVTFLSLLMGPDNTADYTYMGLLDVARGRVVLTAKSTYTIDTIPVRALNWVLARVWTGRDIAPARVWHVGRCGRCGRALTVPASIASGFGPECVAKLSE